LIFHLINPSFCTIFEAVSVAERLRVDRTNIAVDTLTTAPEDHASPTAMRTRLKTHMINNGRRLLALNQRRLLKAKIAAFSVLELDSKFDKVRILRDSNC